MLRKINLREAVFRNKKYDYIRYPPHMKTSVLITLMQKYLSYEFIAVDFVILFQEGCQSKGSPLLMITAPVRLKIEQEV